MSVLQSVISDPERQLAYPLHLWPQQDLLTSREISAFHISLYPESKACIVFFQMVTLSYPVASPHKDSNLKCGVVGWF